MALSVAGKYAIITGAGSGINLAFARLLLQRGCSVMIGDLALRPEAQSLLQEYPTAGPSQRPSALFQRTDVTSWPQLSALMDAGRAAFPRIDIVVAGAGIFDPTWASFWQPPATATNAGATDSRDRADAAPGHYATLDVNLTHPIRLAQLAVGYWTTERLPGTYLAVSSAAGHMAGIGMPLYFASKHGLHGFVRSLGALRDAVGVRVCAVAPGSVQTPLWSEDPQKKGMQGPEDVLIEPEEIANGMLELCENPEYGDGTIFEVLKGKTRVVPLYGNTVPAGEGLALSGYVAFEKELIKGLQGDGLRV